jgi:hypothetical protein
MRYLTLLILIPLIFSCTGKEKLPTDTTPPTKATMIPHVGDLGDATQGQYTVKTPDGDQIVTVYPITDDNNGIDTVPDDNWLRVQWSTLYDDDLDYLYIWRLRKNLIGPYDLTKVDSIRIGSPAPNSYLDHSLSEGEFSPLGTDWYYFIELVDQAGNSTVSDTVGYHLSAKVIQDQPSFEQHIESPYPVTFKWYCLTSETISHYRLLLLSESKSIIWSQDVYDTDPNTSYLEVIYGDNTTQEPVLNSGEYYWRVDAFMDGEAVAGGSESNEVPFYYGR